MPTSSERPSSEDFHTLGLEPDAALFEVKKAYRDLAKQWHPDRFHQHAPRDRRRSEEKFKEITGAYRRISRDLKSREKAHPPHPGSQEDRQRPAGPRRSSPDRNGKEATSPAGRASIKKVWRVLQPEWRFPAVLTTRKIAWSLTALVICGLVISFVPGSDAPSRRSLPSSPESISKQTPHPATSIDRQPGKAGPRGAPGNLISSEQELDQTVDPGRETTTPHFTLGSSEAHVLRVQGPPAKIHGQTWFYGLSEIQFREGRVWRYNNFDHSLRVRLVPSHEPSGSLPSFFTVGSTQDEVLLVQGTPTRVDGSKWYFGFSEVRFRHGRVDDYDNYFGNLKVRLLPSKPSDAAARNGCFTIGSTQDEVLTVQGTPTSIQGNFWFYQFSNILFRDGRVQHVVNAAGNLHFIPPDDLAKQMNKPE